MGMGAAMPYVPRDAVGRQAIAYPDLRAQLADEMAQAAQHETEMRDWRNQWKAAKMKAKAGKPLPGVEDSTGTEAWPEFVDDWLSRRPEAPRRDVARAEALAQALRQRAKREIPRMQAADAASREADTWAGTPEAKEVQRQYAREQMAKGLVTWPGLDADEFLARVKAAKEGTK
jgi:hypothetical protein